MKRSRHAWKVGRNRPTAAAAQDVRGASTSACKMNRRIGTNEDVLSHSLWVPGEGWVRWSVISRAVDAAHDAWRARMALRGVRITDGWEQRDAEIGEAVRQKRAA